MKRRPPFWFVALMAFCGCAPAIAQTSAVPFAALATASRAAGSLAAGNVQAPAPNVQILNVQAVVNAAAPGTVVTLPAQALAVHGLHPKSGVSLQGAGPGKTVVSTEMVLAGCSDLTISDLTLRNDGLNYLLTTTGRPSRITFRNVVFESAAGRPVRLTNADGVTLTHCSFDDSQTLLGAASFDNCTGLTEAGGTHRHRRGRTTYRFCPSAIIGATDLWDANPGKAAYSETGGPDFSWSPGITFSGFAWKGVGARDTDRAHNSYEGGVAQYWPPPGSPYWLYCLHPALDSPCALNVTLMDGLIANCTGLEFWNGAVDCVVTNVKCYGVDWLLLHPDNRPGRNLPVTGCSVTGCSITNPPGTKPGFIGIRQFGPGLFSGNTVAENAVNGVKN